MIFFAGLNTHFCNSASGKTQQIKITSQSGLKEEDIQRLVKEAEMQADADKEKALFHLYNSVKEKGGHMLLTATKSPAALPFILPDLKSRLLLPRAPGDEEAPAEDLAAQLNSKPTTDDRCNYRQKLNVSPRQP